MARESGWQGTGIMSSGRKTVVCSRILRRTSVRVRRSVAGSKFSEAAGVLDGLEGYASDAGLLEGEVDGLADFVVV